MIQVQECSLAYDGVPVLDRVGCSVRVGEVYGIIGPNGSGKSTLLRLISGVERPDSGTVQVDGRPVGSYSRRKLARFMAVLEQEALPAVGFTVREVVEMGRYPHQDWLGRERKRSGGRRPEGHAAGANRAQAAGVDSAVGMGSGAGVELFLDGIMERLDLVELSDRTLEQLSGGERQRAALGKAMAQEPCLLLLDEPTTYLDIGYQLQMMNYIRKWNREWGLTVVAVLHDLNLAAQYCDRLMVLKDGKLVAEGKPWDVMQAELIERVYGTRPLVVEHPVTGAPQILLQAGGFGEMGERRTEQAAAALRVPSVNGT